MNLQQDHHNEIQALFLDCPRTFMGWAEECLALKIIVGTQSLEERKTPN